MYLALVSRRLIMTMRPSALMSSASTTTQRRMSVLSSTSSSSTTKPMASKVPLAILPRATLRNATRQFSRHNAIRRQQWCACRAISASAAASAAAAAEDASTSAAAAAAQGIDIVASARHDETEGEHLASSFEDFDLDDRVTVSLFLLMLFFGKNKGNAKEPLPCHRFFPRLPHLATQFF